MLTPLAIGMLVASPISGISRTQGFAALASLGLLVAAAGLALIHARAGHELLVARAVPVHRRRRLWHVQLAQHGGDDGSRCAHRRGSPLAPACWSEHGRCLSIAFVMAVVTSGINRNVLFNIFSGLGKRITATQMAPFLSNMHLALWCMAALSIVGAGVSFARPKHVAHPSRGGHTGGSARRAAVRARTRTRPLRPRLLRPDEYCSRTGCPTARCRATMRIGEVAELTGTTPRTIRYYEEIGLLTRGTDRELGKHRCYSQEDVNRIKEIVRLKDLLGLSLEQLSQLLEAETARAEIRREYQRNRRSRAPARRCWGNRAGHIASSAGARQGPYQQSFPSSRRT